MDPTVLDPCCGSRMMWFDKQDQRVLFGDQRTESHVLSDGRALEIKPDVKLDFTNLPFPDNRFLIPFENYTGISLIDYTKFRNDLIKIQKMH